MPNVKPVPEGMHTITPQLVCKNASSAIEFYQKAFGAKLEGKFMSPDGKWVMHSSLKIGDSPFFVVDEMPDMKNSGPETLKGSPVMLNLYVENADSFVTRAAQAGAKVTMPVADQFWGDRYGQLKDPYGHLWAVATHVREVPREEMEKAAKEAFSTQSRK
jgi:PhnB protein